MKVGAFLKAVALYLIFSASGAALALGFLAWDRSQGWRLTELKREFKPLEERLAAIEKTVGDLQTSYQREAVTTQVPEVEAQPAPATGKSVPAPLVVKGLLLKGQGEVLKAKVDLAEKNAGKAAGELLLAARTLREAALLAGDRRQVIEETAAMVDAARKDLYLDIPTASDRIELVWHTIGVLLLEGRP